MSFDEASADDLPFESGSFDVVLANFALHQFANAPNACAEAYGVLADGGRFVFASPVEHVGFATVVAALTASDNIIGEQRSPMQLDWSLDYYEHLVAAAGFEISEVAASRQILHVDTLEPLLIAAWDLHELYELPASAQGHIRDTISEQVAPCIADDGYRFDDLIVVGTAVKRDRGSYNRSRLGPDPGTIPPLEQARRP